MGTSYILNAYEKWKTTPVIVTLDDMPTFVQDVSKFDCIKTAIFKLPIYKLNDISFE